MALSTAKVVTALFENAIKTYEHQTQLLEQVSVFTPDAADMQNSNNVIWRPVQQQAPIKSGWDMTGQAGDVLELNYPLDLGTPSNDMVEVRADDMRDMRFWERRGEQSGMKQASYLNSQIANLIKNTGTHFYRSNSNGYDFVAEAGTLLNERQVAQDEGKTFILNNRDQQRLASDLAARGTLSGRPEGAYGKGMIGRDIAGFDVFEGSYLTNLVGGASPDATVTSTLSFKPEATVVQGGVDINVDYRRAIIPVTSSSAYNVGDKIKFVNGGTDITSVSLTDKNDTGEAMTFTVVSKPNSTQLEVFPKPIALGDSSLSAEEAAYANINTQIASGAVVERLNTDASARTNLFFAKDSIEVIGGTIPAQLMAEFAGKKVISQTMKNGQTMYLIYDGDIETMNFRFRLFTWWGLCNARPDANGVAVYTG